MNIKFDNQVYEINKLLRQEKLVVFIGAGVSMNSNYPSWEELAKVFSTIYTKKPFDKNKDDFLKVFENAYIKNKKKFLEEVGNSFGKKSSDCDIKNSIIDIILKMNPKHIITTNYDYLIEKGIENSLVNYNKIVKNEDLINKSSSNQYIKMHGDYEHPDYLVLSETQYLDFSSSHSLIETYIKSLLIDHTFLFIGYSYQDMNLKIIMRWLKQRITSKEKNKIKHYFIWPDNEKIEIHTKRYFLNNNIEIIEYNSLIKSTNFENIKIPLDITDKKGKNLFTILHYIKSNMSTIDGLKYLTKKYDEVNSFFPEDFIEYLGLTKFVFLHEFFISVKRDGSINENINWVNKLFKNLDLSIRNGKPDANLEKLKRLFFKCGISFGLYYDNGKEKEFCFFNGFSPQDDICKNLDLMDFDYLNDIRKNLQINTVKSDNDLMKLMYLNEIFNISNSVYRESLIKTRSCLFSEKKYLMMYLVSINLENINPFQVKNIVSTYQILKNIPEFSKKNFKTAFAITINSEKHTSIMMKGFMESVFSLQTVYTRGSDPQMESEKRFINYVRFYSKNFLTTSFNSTNLKVIVKIYMSTLFSNIYNYETYLKKASSDSFIFFNSHIMNPHILLGYIIIFTRYLSYWEIQELLNKYNISKIVVKDFYNQLLLCTNNIINSLAKFPNNKIIKQQFLSFIFIFPYFDYNFKSINNLSDKTWDIIDKELANDYRDSFKLIEYLFNVIELTETKFDEIFLLEKINKSFLFNKIVFENQIYLVELVSKKCNKEQASNNFNLRKLLDDLIEIYCNNKTNNLLSVLLLQVDFISPKILDKFKENILNHYKENTEFFSVMNIYIILSKKILFAGCFEKNLKIKYNKLIKIQESKQNTFGREITEDISFINRMIKEKLINDFEDDSQ